MADEPFDATGDDDLGEPPWTVAVCPVTPELAAQLADMVQVDWTDPDAGERAMAAAGWESTGEYLGDLDQKAHTPAGHLVYGDDCLAMPFAYEYYVHPDGAVAEDFWSVLPGWHGIVDPPAGSFGGQVDAVVETFTALLGPPDHDVTHARRPELDHEWRYRAWRRGDNVLVVAPGLDGFSYSQFEHAFVQIRSLPATTQFPAPEELPDFFW
ncbi:hypothetical protein [Streptomyces sp. NK08204]|uniref:hypothetical protein n=1 Tax=Streptomyces sp. NK08204 TaxID=2873260 RepID=UPI001CEDECDF|nr:hypothetical protein [Streptomyces sp. NK08204]